MRRRHQSLLAVLVTAVLGASLGLTPEAAHAAVPAGTITPLRPLSTFATSAYNGTDYSAADVVESYLEADGDLGVVTVDTKRHTVTVDTYDGSTYAHQGTPQVVDFPTDWPLFGGVYTAPSGEHFLLTGRTNPQENDDREVVSVRRYSADWSRTGDARLTGGARQGGVKGISTPFDASAADMLARDGRLVVHMGRTIYDDGHGNHHQTDLTFEVDLDTMKAKTFDQLGESPYASHSFRQLLASAGDDLVLADHGDSYPRGLQVSVVSGYPAARTVRSEVVFPFSGDVEDNHTGTQVTGLVSGPSGVLVTGSSVPHGHEVDGVTGMEDDYAENIFVISVDPETLQKSFQWLTDLSPTGDKTALEPRITQVGANRFVLLYSVRDGASTSMRYRLLDSSGEVLASASWDDAYFSPVSDPVLTGDRLLWAGLDRSTKPSDPSAATYLSGLDLTDPAAPVRLGSEHEVLSTDSALRSVRLQSATLKQKFSAATTSYSATGRKKWVGVAKAVPREPNARLQFRQPGDPWSDGPFSSYLSRGGTATQQVRVIAEDGKAKTVYTFTFKRPR